MKGLVALVVLAFWAVAAAGCVTVGYDFLRQQVFVGPAPSGK